MMKNTRRGMDRKGHMPMALIAVTLLLAGAFYGVICANVERNSENADSENAEFVTVDDAVQRARITIQSELGRIITEISSAMQGTLTERSAAFGELSDRMFEERFPNTLRGVTTEVLDRSVKLSLESARTDSAGLGGGDTRASFLKASGTVELQFTTESTTTKRTLTIDADATSALPLVAEASTLFELSVGGSGSAMSQMIEYQLKSLASNRVLAGYGMRSAGGAFGTASIITEADVHRAVYNALNILEAMYFRDCSDGNLLKHPFADLGDLIVLEDGYITLDLGALYSQAILQRLDEYVVQWIDYIGADIILDAIDFAADAIHTFVNFLRKAVESDPDKRDATQYIKKQMSSMGYSEDYYRHLVVDVGSVTLDSFTFTIEGYDGKTHIITTKPVEYDAPPITTDLLDWDGWGGVMKDYRKHTNQFKESLRWVLNAVALEACNGMTYRVPLDAFDSQGYADEIERCVRQAADGCIDGFIDRSIDRVKGCEISDTVMMTMYDAIRENRREVFGGDYLNGFKEGIWRTAAEGIEFSFFVRPAEVEEEFWKRIDLSWIENAYWEQVDVFVDRLNIFLDATKEHKYADQLASTAGDFLRSLHLEDYVKKVAVGLTKEMSEIIRMNPYSNVPALPGTDRFALVGEDGTVYSEKLTVTDSKNLNVNIIDPIRNSSRNTHYVGFFEDRDARYSSVFTVNISGTIDYRVSSTNPLYTMMGTSDSVYTGTISIDASMDIACMSGWGLAGTEYRKSNTLFGDLADIVKEFIARIVEFLREPVEVIMGGLETALNATTTAIVEYGNYLNRLMQGFYDAISIPLEYLHGVLDWILQQLLGRVDIEDIIIMLGSQKVILDFFGMKLTIEANLKSLSKTSKQLIKVTAERELGGGTKLMTCLDFRENSKYGRYVLITGGATGDDWSFNLTLDPQMASGSTYATVRGYVRDVEFSGTIPELVQYQIIDISTDDVPGLRETLNNIVLPLVGYKASVEIGLYAKYDLPVEKGILINEVEANPEGDDRGCEWVEILNSTDETTDLLGYTLVPKGNDKKSVSIGDVVLAPGQRTVIYLPDQVLKNDGKGCQVTLYDTYGNVVDRSPLLKDTSNDDSTWQRSTDGSVNWSFMPGTEDSKNRGEFAGAAVLKTMLIDFAKDAAIEVLDEMGDRVQGTDQTMEYAERVVARIVEKFIDCVADCLVEACAFVKFELTDYTQSQHFGMKIMLGVDSDLVRDVLRYLAAMIPVIGEHIDNPEGITAGDILCQDVFLRTLVYTGISAPKFLGNVLDDTEIDAAISVRFNISAVTALFGEEKGRWHAEAGIVFENIPTQMVPESLDPKPYMKSDLWLFRMSFFERKS